MESARLLVRTMDGSGSMVAGARSLTLCVYSPPGTFTVETSGRIRVSNPSVLVNLLQALLAIILGNIVYFLLLPSLPPAARHHPFRLDLGTVLDFWFCLVIYGVIRTARKWR